MRTCIFPLILVAAVFCSAPVSSEEANSGITREQALGITDLVTRPVREVIVPAVDNAMITAAAASWALWDLANGLADQQAAGEAPAADLRLAETYLRLTMRCNSGDLCLSAGSRCKAYPADADFAKMARTAAKDIDKYAAALKGQSPLKPRHRDRIQGFMNLARKRAIFSLRMTSETVVRPGPETAEETGYLQLAAGKKKGPDYTFPPWH